MGFSEELGVVIGAGCGVGEDAANLAGSDPKALVCAGLAPAPETLHPRGVQPGVGPDAFNDRGGSACWGVSPGGTGWA